MKIRQVVSFMYRFEAEYGKNELKTLLGFIVYAIGIFKRITYF